MSAPHLPEGFNEDARAGAPRVTVVTAVLNGAATIQGALESVASQTAAADVEHVVVDGGSVDATLALVRRAGHRPRLIVGHDHGVYDAFNRGLAAARGEWIAFLNADDVYAHPGVIEAVLAAAARRPEVDVLHGDLDWVDEAGRVVRRGRFADRRAGPDGYARFARELPIFHPSTFCRRRMFVLAGGFDATYAVAGDYDLFLRAWLAGARFGHVDEVLARMRTGGLSERAHLVADLEVVRAWRRRAGAPAGAVAARLLHMGAVHLLSRVCPGALAAIRAARQRGRVARASSSYQSR